MSIRSSEEEQEFPRDGDNVFVSGQKDWQNTACLNITHDNLRAYETGYKLAGDVIYQHVLHTQSDQDVLVYPMMFMYRHYLELRLKQLTWEGAQLINQEAEYPHGHSLMDLWRKCRPILEPIYDGSDPLFLDRAEKLIEEIHKHDENGEAFRYSEKNTKKEKIKYLSNITHINLRNVAEVMRRLGYLLDCASTGVVAMLGEKLEMESDYRDMENSWREDYRGY